LAAPCASPDTLNTLSQTFGAHVSERMSRLVACPALTATAYSAAKPRQASSSECECCRQMLRDELALKTAMMEELTYEAEPADLAQLQALWSGAALQL